MKIRFIDLFCGIGGFRYAMEGAAKSNNLETECVLSSDIDADCQKAYKENFGDDPVGDIQKIPSGLIPDHDILLAGFPCQPFSIIGSRKGFEDARGTLFFEIARILEGKKPKMFVLENVKLLAGHNNGKTLSRILEVLRGLGYFVDFKILNALDFGLPQRRERIFIVGLRGPGNFSWPHEKIPMKALSQLLEKKIPKKFFASKYIREKRNAMVEPTSEPTIWHENKSGHVSAYPYSCALRAGASYNYLLVNGERRLTPREMLRLQGFPDAFRIVCNDSQTRKQAGNSLPVPVAEAVIKELLVTFKFGVAANQAFKNRTNPSLNGQMILFEKSGRYGKNTKAKNRRKIQTPIPA
ncbi:MAG: DNA (cytosine-5-)-methyltransferase [Elusimicrobia bacterium]|nr:DNA (cytosine-5-)-methyltransferase [Elusimicrobiota bacterium]